MPALLPMIAVFGVMSAPLYILGIVLLCGKGAFLIGGYNTMPKPERDKYDEKALCRATGRLLIAIATVSLLFPAAIALNRTWLTWTAIGLFVAVTASGVVYMNTGGRYKK